MAATAAAATAAMGASSSSSIPDGANGSSDLACLLQFGKHVPSVLIKQLTTKIVNRYMSRNIEVELSKPPHSFSCTPSIERFYGALLFVDISGFTVLSQKLSVDDLRLHINAYFTKILSTVYMYGGDVVKFAGDALFIVWPAEVQNPTSRKHMQSVKKAVACAVSCGLEVNAACTDHPIPLPHSEPNITYLNVHSGVSVGTMAGMDVGAHDRWEYLLFGSCLKDVAIAEGKAGKGDLVLSPLACEILHDYVPILELREMMKDSPPCNCAIDGDDYCTIAGYTVQSKYHAQSTEQLGVQHDDFDDSAADAILKSKVPMSVATYIGDAFMEGRQKMIEEFKEEWSSFDKSVRSMASKRTVDATARSSLTDLPDKTSHVSSSSPFARNGSVTESNTAEDCLFDHYVNYCEKCLTDDTGRHVHEVERGSYKFKNFIRTNASAMFMQQYSSDHRTRKTAALAAVNPPLSFNSLTMKASSTSNKMINKGENSISKTTHSMSNSFVEKLKASVTSGIFFENSEFATQIRLRSQKSFLTPQSELESRRKQSISEQKHAYHEKLLKNDASLSAELRNVIVLFISVQLPTVELFLDPVQKQEAREPESEKLGESATDIKNGSFTAFSATGTRPPDSPFFLSRSAAEVDADSALLALFQSCMVVLTDVCTDTGGQLRQFIVDDKGTVAILTFGLKGSVGSDSAASAMEAAQQVIYGVQDLGFNASVGVTSGKVYCGPVGSIVRQEYAVMGPSTNLAARLMGKAKPGEIICDIVIRDRDRFHKFSSLAEVKAKGYTNPVPIFKPNFGYRRSYTATNMMSKDDSATGADLLKDAISAVAHLASSPTLKLEVPTSSQSQDEDMAPLGVCHDIQKQQKTKRGRHGLYGREEEVGEIVTFLVPEVGTLLLQAPVVNKSESSTPLAQNTPTTSGNNAKRCLSVDDPVRLAIIEGPVGIGKSSVLSAVRKAFRNVLLRKDSAALRCNNFQILASQTSVVVSLEPFSCWKPIIRSMLLSLRKFYIMHNNGKSDTIEGQKAQVAISSKTSATSSRSYYKELNHAFEIIAPSLPQELRDLKCLLVSAHILRASEEEEEDLRSKSSKLDVNERLGQTCDLLAAIMEHYVITMNKIAVIFM